MERLIYLSLTRLEIIYAVDVVNQFMHAPTQDYIEVVYRILRYLKGCLGIGLLYMRYRYHRVEVYTKADWAGSLIYRRSTSEYYSLVGGNLVTC